MKTKFYFLSALLGISFSIWSQGVGINETGAVPDESAILDVSSTGQGVLVPRMTTNQRNTIANPALGLVVFNLTLNCLEWYDGVVWRNGCGIQSFVENGCNSINPTVIEEVTNPSTGKTWMDRNLGAKRVATSSTDSESYGFLFQWGRESDGHQCVSRYSGDGVTTSGTTTNLSSSDAVGHDYFVLNEDSSGDWINSNNDDLWQGAHGTNNPCPEGFRLPTEVEFNEERLSWSSNNAAGAFSSSLKLPVAGGRNYNDGALIFTGARGRYWTSTFSGANAKSLTFSQFNEGIANLKRANGASVRCIKDYDAVVQQLVCNSVVHNGNLHENYEASNVNSVISYNGGNGGSHSGAVALSTGVTGLTATLGAGSFEIGAGSLTFSITGTPSVPGTATFDFIIGGQICTVTRTVSPTLPNICNPSMNTLIIDVTNPSTGETWMDRNIGASQVATSSTDAQSYGSLYQWGRGSDGHQCVNRFVGDGVNTSSTTATLSSTNSPTSNHFITINSSPNDWRSPQNDNLWQGVNGINNPCPTGYRLPTDAELNAERASWMSNNATGAFSSPLKLPKAGGRSRFSGELVNVDDRGSYWSSTVASLESYRLFFDSSNADLTALQRSNGASVRCIKN